MQSIDRIVNYVTIINHDLAVITGILMIGTSVIKELMARFSVSIGKKIKSGILIADAWHHRSDAFTNIVVGVGIIGSTFGYPMLDPVFGVIVSMVIIYVGVELVRTASNFLIGQAPDQELIDEIDEMAKSVDGVCGVHMISVHDYGTSKAVSLHAEVENYLTLDEAHIIADNIENKINKEMNYTTIVRLDPKEMKPDAKLSKRKKRRIINEILKNQGEIISFHKIKIIRMDEKDDIKVHLIVDKDMSVEDSHELCHNLQSLVRREYGLCDLDIHLEPCRKDCKVCTLSCSNRREGELIEEMWIK